jgi:membrane fusion protein, multidrug efflux system
MRTILKRLLPILALCACQSKAGNREEPELITTLANEPTQVQTVMSRYQPFEYLVQSNGKVRPLKEQVWFAEQNRALKNFNGQNGTRYSAGQLIAQFETDDLAMKLQKARLDQYNTEKEYQSALLGYENLLKDKPAEEVEAIKKKLRISSGLAYAEQEIKQLEFELDRSAIRAPFNGVLAGVQVQSNTKPPAAQEMFRLYDPAELVVEISVLEADIYLLKPGLVAEVSPLADRSQVTRASLLRINPYVDENGMVTITLKLNANGQKFFPGMNCTATIKIPMSSSVIVPKEAIVMHDGRPVVFTVEQGLAKWHYVVTGRENGTWVEIKEGLKQNQKVIVTNNLQLAHDAQVREITGKTK